MNFREWFERRVDETERAQTPTVPAQAGDAVAHQEREALLRAADEAIERALSADSQAFLASTRQQGGQ
jgi:hypothetical protein